MNRSTLCSTLACATLAHFAAAGAMTFIASGDAPSIQSQLDAFRTALGPLNPNGPGSLGGGRREINWDGVPDAFSSPNAFPGDFFNFTSGGRARGALFETPSGLLECSARLPNPTGTEVRFGHIEPNYVEAFTAFSPQRLFAPIGSVVTTASFFVPGTVSVPAGVTGFGAIFTDVDVEGSTSIVCLDKDDKVIGLATAPPAPGDGLLSFAGVIVTGPERIARVVISSGNLPLAVGNLDEGIYDVVAMDDFIYGEPISLLCPSDLNGDGTVNSADLGLFLAAWGPQTSHPADFNGDGAVWSDDLGLLIADWGDCPR
jgi:hypothetical protein